MDSQVCNVLVSWDPIGNIRIGNHPRVSALMSGIFNKRPPQIKYQFIWDVETALDFLRKLKGNDLFLDKLLYLHWRSQCCYHCCLPQGYQRSQIWEWIIWQNINLFNKYVIDHLTKTCQRGRKPHLNLKFYKSPGDSKLSFLVSHIKPHKPVSQSTVSRWLGHVLAMTSTNTKVLKAHSTQSASRLKLLPSP